MVRVGIVPWGKIVNEPHPRKMRQNEREKREEERGTAPAHSPVKFNDSSSAPFNL